MRPASRIPLIGIGLATALAGCNGLGNARQYPIPKGAKLVPLGDRVGMYQGRLQGFWQTAGDFDAPQLRLIIATDARHYTDRPQRVALELRCEPWAGGVEFGAAAVMIGLAPPTQAPGKTLTLDAGRATLSGSAHVRNFGYTDTAIPGAFVPAEALDLPGLAQARQMTVTWGERRSTLPAPSPEKLADFTRRCGDGLQQGAATPAG